MSSSTPKYRTRPIGQMRTGQRVLARNPQLDPAEVVSSDIDPTTWRNVRLRMPKIDGGELNMVLLRPVEWLHENGIDERSFAVHRSESAPPSHGILSSSYAATRSGDESRPWHSVTRATSKRSNAVASLFASIDTQDTGAVCRALNDRSQQSALVGWLAADPEEPMDREVSQFRTNLQAPSTTTEPPSQPWIFLELYGGPRKLDQRLR